MILVKNISICQRGNVHGGCWVNFPTTVGNWEVLTLCYRKFEGWVRLIGNRAVADHVLCVSPRTLKKNLCSVRKTIQKRTDRFGRSQVKLSFTGRLCTKWSWCPAQVCQRTCVLWTTHMLTVAIDTWSGKWNDLSMTYRLTIDGAKNYCNRLGLLIVQVIVENVVTCFFLRHSALSPRATALWFTCI